MTKTKGLRITTPCASVEQFIAAFHRFCEESSFFVSTLSLRPVGIETAFSVDLSDGRSMLRGFGVVLDAWPTAANRFGRPGVRIGVHELTTDTKSVFEQLLIARAITQSQPAAQRNTTRQLWAIDLPQIPGVVPTVDTAVPVVADDNAPATVPNLMPPLYDEPRVAKARMIIATPRSIPIIKPKIDPVSPVAPSIVPTRATPLPSIIAAASRPTPPPRPIVDAPVLPIDPAPLTPAPPILPAVQEQPVPEPIAPAPPIVATAPTVRASTVHEQPPPAPITPPNRSRPRVSAPRASQLEPIAAAPVEPFDEPTVVEDDTAAPSDVASVDETALPFGSADGRGHAPAVDDEPRIAEAPTRSSSRWWLVAVFGMFVVGVGIGVVVGMQVEQSRAPHQVPVPSTPPIVMTVSPPVAPADAMPVIAIDAASSLANVAADAEAVDATPADIVDAAPPAVIAADPPEPPALVPPARPAPKPKLNKPPRPVVRPHPRPPASVNAKCEGLSCI